VRNGKTRKLIVPLAISVATVVATAATIATTALTVATTTGCDDDDGPKVDAGPPDTPII
jgi:hypothetical protein